MSHKYPSVKAATVQMKTPIVIFGFNRPHSIGRLIESIKTNPTYGEHEYFIFIDGHRTEEEKVKVDHVEELAYKLTPNVFRAKSNKGLARSVIDGVTEIISKYRRVIVLEDDLVLMPGCLNYLEEALNVYENDSRIFSVCAYGLKIKRPKDYSGDVYLGVRSSSWGWATWKDRWMSVDWNVSDWQTLRSSKQRQKALNRCGSDMFGMLRDYMEGRNNSWAIRFCYSQHLQGRYSVHPFESLVANEGFGADATNCQQKYSRFKIRLHNDNTQLLLPPHLEPRESILRENAHYHSLPLRLYSWIRRKLNF